jgi:hypothetical protein
MAALTVVLAAVAVLFSLIRDGAILADVEEGTVLAVQAGAGACAVVTATCVC